MGKFDGNEDMLFHLEELKKGWSQQEMGDFDCDLMEVVEGTEVAASAFFNGHDFLRNKDGKIVGFINFEEKKECDGNLGETTGETGTTFFGCTEDNELFSKIIVPGVVEKLQEIGFRGVFDINGSMTKDGYVAFEPTDRFGVPATSYEFIEGMVTDPAVVLEAMAKGLDIPVEIHEGWGQVIVIAGKPYPIEADVDERSTSLGEKLWILGSDGKPKDNFSEEQKKHIHLYNFERIEDEDGSKNYKVVTKSGYLLTITGRGDDIEDCREKLLKYVKENIYLSGMKYRQDLGKRVENFEF